MIILKAAKNDSNGRFFQNSDLLSNWVQIALLFTWAGGKKNMQNII